MYICICMHVGNVCRLNSCDMGIRKYRSILKAYISKAGTTFNTYFHLIYVPSYL